MEVAKNEKELNALSWWKGLDKGTKTQYQEWSTVLKRVIKTK